MSSDETAKTEPTVIDAPPIAAAEPQAAENVAPKLEAVVPEAPKIEAPAIKAKAEPVKVEPKPEAKAEQKPEPKAEPRIEASTLPPAAQLAESPAIIRLRRQEPKPAARPQPAGSKRFALLAACVAIAASFGAIGGSLGVAKLAPMISPAPAPLAVAAPKDTVGEELKALKETVAQLRTATRGLSENLATLKVSVSTSNVTQNAQNAQIGKIAEILDRVEKAQAEQRKLAVAAPAAPETTGSIVQKSAAVAPMVLGDPPTTLKPPILQDYVLRRVYDGAALIEGRHGIIEVEPGITAPGLGRIEAIRRQDGRWVVVTARGLIVQR
jgi:hypothetical protein